MFNNKLLNLKVIFMLDGKSIHTSVSINVFLNIEAIYYGFLNTEVAYSFKTLISTLKKFHDQKSMDITILLIKSLLLQSSNAK